MKRFISTLIITALVAFAATASYAQEKSKTTMTDTKHPKVRLTTNKGVIELELDAEKAPKTVENFLHYVNNGHYNGVIFHRVIPGFMIQGGGMEPGMKERDTDTTVENEADNGLKNDTGTIAMARTNDPQSASAQFFINVADNAFLNHKSKDIMGWGYAVFGKVSKGMDVVKSIEGVPTGSYGPFSDVPKEDVIIEKAEVIE